MSQSETHLEEIRMDMLWIMVLKPKKKWYMGLKNVVFNNGLQLFSIVRWNLMLLTHWGLVTHICVSKLIIIGSDNGLSPGRCQAIIWTNAGILLFRPLGTKFSEILIEIHAFSFTKMHLKMSSGKWRPFCLGLYVLNTHACSDISGCMNQCHR